MSIKFEKIIYEQPRKKKIASYKIVSSNDKNVINYSLWNIFQNQLKIAPLSNYGFSLFLFMRKLLLYIEKNNVKDVYFCSREGEFIKRAFDKFLMLNEKENSISTHYLLVSRKSTFLPSLDPNIKKETFSTLERTTKYLSIREFIEVLGMTVDDFGLNQEVDIDKPIYNFFKSDEFDMLKNDTIFLQKYSSAVLLAKREFKDYLEVLGINNNTQKITIVDIGWKGTIQDNLYNLFNGEKAIEGLYYGLEGDVIFGQGNMKHGLVYTNVPVKSKYFEIFSTNHRMLERVLQASHGSANYYQNGKCVLSDMDEGEIKLYDCMKKNQIEILKLIESIDCIFKSYLISDYQAQRIIANIHSAYLMCYTKKLDNQIKATENLMNMGFGTVNKKMSKKAILKSAIRKSKIEKINKLLKLLRKLHCNIIADITVYILYCNRKKVFLEMEI